MDICHVNDSVTLFTIPKNLYLLDLNKNKSLFFITGLKINNLEVRSQHL